MYRVSKFQEKKGDASTTYIMVRITRKEACELIQSLAAQLEAGNPNAGRAEPRFETEDHKEGGHFTISVLDPLVCFLCHRDIEPYQGIAVKSELACKPCAKKLVRMTCEERHPWKAKNERCNTCAQDIKEIETGHYRFR